MHKISGAQKFPTKAKHAEFLKTTVSTNRSNASANLNNGHFPQYDEGSVDDHGALVSRIDLLEKDLERRQESYVARERAYKLRIDELEEELANQRREKTGWMKADGKMNKLKEMQGLIMKNVELVQDRTAKILQEQERDLLRAFRARLFDVQTELEKEKSKKDDGAGAWIEHSRNLEAEVEWAKEVADRLERVNQSLVQENARLKSQFDSQEEDRSFLIKQLVDVKKDNAKLRAEYSAIESENELLKQQKATVDHLLQSQPAMGSGGAGMMGGSLGAALGGKAGGAAPPKTATQENSDERFKEVNARLRRLLTEERKSLQTVRQNYSMEIKSRTEMELLLRQCVEDVRKEIARRNMESAQFSQNSGHDLTKLYGRTPGLIPVEEFSQEDRERVLELLLAQERVVTLLYAKTFPVLTNKNKGGTLALDAGTGIGDKSAALPHLGPLVALGGALGAGGNSNTAAANFAVTAATSSDDDVGMSQFDGDSRVSTAAGAGDRESISAGGTRDKLPPVNSTRPHTGSTIGK